MIELVNLQAMSLRLTQPLAADRYTLCYYDHDNLFVGQHGEFWTYGQAAMEMAHHAENLIGMGYEPDRVREVLAGGKCKIQTVSPKGFIS